MNIDDFLGRGLSEIIKVTHNKQQVDVTVPMPQTVAEFLERYGERRVVMLLQRMVRLEYRRKARAVLSKGDDIESISGWLPGGTLPATEVEKALSALKWLSDEDKHEFMRQVVKEGIIKGGK